MNINSKPEGFHTIVPNAIVKSVEKAVEFYTKIFGAKEALRLNLPNGKVVHCELIFGDSRIHLGESMEGWPEQPLLAQIYVIDSDETFNLALKAGAKELSPMRDMFFGTREGRIIDPFGNIWTISTHKEVVSSQEMQDRLNALYS